MTIYYVHQDPLIAWDFSKKRQEKQGRLVPKETFINAYFKSRQNIQELKSEFRDKICLHLIHKDYQDNISDIQFDVDSIELLLPEKYTREDLEEKLYD